MDCCNMPMAAWPGGGYVCRKCQAKVGVSWRRDPNPFARAVEEPVEQDMEPKLEPVKIIPGIDISPETGSVLSADAFAEKFPVEQPKVSGIGRGGGRKGGSK